MASLTTCLKRVGAKLDPADKDAILARARDNRAAGMGATEAATKAARDLMAELRDELKAMEPPKPAPAPKATTHPDTVMGSRLLAIVSQRLGGLDPTWIAEFSVRAETRRMGKDGRPIVQWRNPPIPGIGRLFRKGGTQDLQALAETLEEAGYMATGTVEREGKEAGEQAKELVRRALQRDPTPTIDQQMADLEAEMARRNAGDPDDQRDLDPGEAPDDEPAPEAAYYPDLDPEAAAELEAERAAIMAEAEMSRQQMESFDDADLWDGQGHSDTAAAMRALGFSEQEIADELAREAAAQGGAQEGAAETGQAAAGQAGPAAADRGAAPGGGAAEEGLTLDAQTPEDLRARADREKAAADADRQEQRRLAEKAKADAERDEFVLTGSDRPADVAAAAGQGGLFDGPSATADAQPAAPSADSPPIADQVQAVPPAEPEQPTENAPEESAAQEEEAAQRIADFGEKIGGARKDTARPTGPRMAREQDDRPTWARKYMVAERTGRDGTKTGKWGVFTVKDGMMSPATRQEFATEQAALDAIPLIEVSRRHRVYAYKDGDKMLYGIYRRLGERKRALVKGGFATETAAMTELATNPAPIIEHKFEFPERPWLDNIERIGPVRRTGNVTPKMFEDTFNFRGGEFGKWNEGGDGQETLNHAYDGLMDLADALGIPPRALSLNGELAIAFGSRGKGGKNAAAAHYERDYGVINLTKMQGAGSLAHEFFHALDHYLGRQDGKASSVKKPNERGDMVYQTGARGDRSQDYVTYGFGRKSNVREELRKAFEGVMAAIRGKPRQVPVDPKPLEKRLERERQSLEYYLRDLRGSLTDGTYNRGKKTATAEQLKQWDALAQKLMAGDVGEDQYIGPNGPIAPDTPAARMGRLSAARLSAANIVAANAIYKAVTGRSFDKTGYDSRGNQILQAARSIREATEALGRDTERAARGETYTQTITTDYYSNARDIDGNRASPYWSTMHEMGARAFESFILDRIAEREGRSDYLVYGAENWHYTLYDMKPYPEGDERKAINAAFSRLFDVIKSRENPDGRVELYEPVSGAYTPTNGSAQAAEPTGQGSGQPGSAAADSVRGARASLRGGAITSIGIAADIQRAGSAALVGRKVAGPDDLAELAQVYRDPRYETFRVFLTKGNEIVHATGVSARMPGRTPMVPAGMSNDDYVAFFKGEMARTGADGYYILHNHPSGNPTPSSSDMDLTNWLADKVPGMKAHVVINSNRYAVIEPGRYSPRLTERDFGPDLLMTAAKPGPLLGRVIDEPDKLVALGKSLQRPGWVTIIGTDSSMGVRVTAEIPAAVLTRPAMVLAAMVRRLMRQSGARFMFMVGTDADVAAGPVQKALKGGILLDAIGETGLPQSGRGVGGQSGDPFAGTAGRNMAEPVLSQTTAGAGIPFADLDRMVSQAADQMPGLRHRPVAVASARDLPAPIVEALRSMNAMGTTRGLRMPDGRIYLIADKLDNMQEAQAVLFHEVYGHEGLRAFLGERYVTQMALLRMANPKLAAEANRWYADYGADQIRARVERGMTRAQAEAQVRALAVEEALADRAGDNEPPKAWKALMAKLQQALRGMGLDWIADRLEAMTEAETFAVLVGARRAIQRGQDVPAWLQPGEQPAASAERPPLLDRRPSVDTRQTEEGRPTFKGNGLVLDFPLPTERVEVIPTPGQEVLNYPIMPADSFESLGFVELLVEGGKVKALLDIYVNPEARGGVGRKVIETLLAADPEASIEISNIVESARGFWASMGIPEQNRAAGEAYDGTLNWQTYAQAQAQDRRGARGDGQAGRAARGRTDAAGEGGVQGAVGEGPSLSRIDQTQTPEFKRWSALLGPSGMSRLVKALSNKAVVDGLERHAKALTDLLERQPGLSERGGLGNVPSAVAPHVLKVADDDQVLRAVVAAIPVDVVNLLAGKQLTPEQLLRDKAMLEDVFAVDGAANVSLAIDKPAAGALLDSVARSATELARLARRALEGDAADGAGAGNPVLRAHGRSVTETEAFSKWFGDSKVVDENGEPLVVYHGTDKDFSAFDPDRIGDNFGVDEDGFFFTSSKIRASGYADPESEFAAAGMGVRRGAEPRSGSNVLPVYLSLQRPLTLDTYTGAFYTSPAVEIDEQGISLTDYFDDNRMSVVEFAKRGGHDGVLFQHKGKTLAIAFRPEQIKSAIGNRGTFDPADANITLSQKPAANAAPTQAVIPATGRAATTTATGLPTGWRDPTNRLQFAPGAWLYEAIGRLARPLLVRANFAAATPELRRQLRQMKLDVQKAQDVAAAVAKEAGTLTEAERLMVSDIIEKELAAGIAPPEHAVRLAALMQQAMTAQSKELVRLGMLSDEAAKRWEGAYLPRFYETKLRKEVKDAWADAVKRLVGRTSAMKGVKGDHLKGRGMYETIPETDLPKYMAMGWEVRDPEYQPGLPAMDGVVQVWRDYTRAEREKMGEIRDAGFRFVMGYMQTQRDIALGRLFEKMANDPASSSRLPREGWVRVPDTTVEGTGAKRYGKLAGRYVPQETLSHLSQIEESQSAAWQMYRKAMSYWKMGKTALNPVSHVNNILSNLTMAHFAGVSYHRGDKYLAAIKDFATGAPAVKEARDAGLFLGTMSDAELMDALPPELRDLATKADSQAIRGAKFVYDAMSFFLRKPMGAAYQAEDLFFRYLLYKDARGRGASPDDAIDWAQRFIFTYDDLPKTARFVRDFGIPFFAYTYKAVPALLHTALTHPARFAAPAAVMWGANAIAYAIAMGDDDDDWWTTLQRYLNDEEFRQKVKEAEQLEREVLPPWMKGSTAMATPKAIRLGMDELTKLPVYIDVARIVPGGDLFDVSPNAGGLPIPQPLTPSHPLLNVAVAMIGNKDLWTGNDLVDKNDTSAEAAEKRGEWIWKQLTPAVAVGNYHWERTLNALAQASGGEIRWLPEFIAEDYTGVGRDGLPVQPKYTAMQTFGIKARPLDLEKSREIAESQQKRLIRDIDAETRQLERLQDAGTISDRVFERKIDEANVKKERLREGLTVDGEPR